MTVHGKMAVTRRLLLTRLPLAVVVIGMVAATSNTYPMRRGAFGWVLIAPLVSLLFHFRIEPKPDPTMVAAHSMDIGAVANPAIGAPSGLR
jgi:hypothetical protein